ncbi:MAG: HVO_2072 family ArtA-dependent S-layer glycoprotein [Haloferacaceae archaeon]
MIRFPDELRVTVVAALVILSAVAGTVALSTAAAAAPAVESSLTVDPTAVPSNSTNSHSFAVNVTTTVDGTNDRLEVTFPGAFALSSPSATLSTNDSANLSKGAVRVVDRTGGGAAETLEVEIVDAGSGGTNASVNLTGSVSAAAPTGEFSGTVRSTYDVGDDGGTTANLDTGSRPVSTYTYAPSYDTAASSGTVYPGATVYLGQDDVTFGGGLGTRLTGVAGDADGRVLRSSIPRDQPVGRYSTDGSASALSVTVDTPRITTFRVENANGEDVSGGTVSAGSAGQLQVVVDYNFAKAEDVELTVENPNGLDVTDDVLTGPAAFNGAHSVGLDLSDGTVGFYTISAEGTDDLDFGDANRTTTVGLLPDRSPSIHVDADSVVQGGDVVYDVSGSSAGTFHLVRIDAGDFRENTSLREQAKIFRNTGDVVERGVVAPGTGPHGRALESASGTATGLEGGVDPADVTAAYAVVEVDDTGLALGSLETRYLDTTSVTLDVSDALLTDEALDPTLLDTDDAGEPVAVSGGGAVGYLFDEGDTSGLPSGYVPSPDADGDVASTDDRAFDRDDVSLDVTEGSLALDSPRTYAVGSRIDLTGNASAEMDDVAVYARNQNEFELVTLGGERTISVGENGTFEATDVTLSAGNSMLSFPGSYRLGVVDAADADHDGDGTVDGTLTVREFGSATSTSRPIRVTNATLDATFTSIVDGQVAQADDGVGVNGTATASTDVVFVAVGSAGHVVTEELAVDDDDTFAEDAISLDALERGRVTLHVLSLGRDGTAGTAGDGPSAAASHIRSFGAASRPTPLTGDQIRSRLRDYTTGAAGSDDALVTESVQLRDARTTIDGVHPAGSAAAGVNPVATGETMVVTGSTNRQPDDAAIAVELRDATDSVALATADDWGTDGEWSVEFDTSGVAPGTYTVLADDGDATDVATVDLVESRATETAASDTATATSATSATTPTATATPTATSTPTETPSPTRSDGPGFGVVVALLAFLAAALLGRW